MTFVNEPHPPPPDRHRLPYNFQIMSDHLIPSDSELTTAKEAEAYDRWFRAKVQKSMDDLRPAASHEEVMATLWKIIEAKRGSNASDPMAS